MVMKAQDKMNTDKMMGFHTDIAVILRESTVEWVKRYQSAGPISPVMNPWTCKVIVVQTFSIILAVTWWTIGSSYGEEKKHINMYYILASHLQSKPNSQEPMDHLFMFTSLIQLNVIFHSQTSFKVIKWKKDPDVLSTLSVTLLDAFNHLRR